MMAHGTPISGACQFDRRVPPGGYAWWYVDAISDDSEFAITLIAFIGSVFSPYYAWAGRADPLNHCALNVALYGRRGRCWAMTERGRDKVLATSATLQIGPSRLAWDADGLTVDVAETGMPMPFPIRGRVRLAPRSLNATSFHIDRAGAHYWQPISPVADVEVDFDQPGVRWRGRGYFDMNFGDSPLEQAFRYWDWSRIHLRDGVTAITYNTDERNGDQNRLALRFGRDGECEALPAHAPLDLAPTRIFRIRRRTSPLGDDLVRLGSTLEDTPFYSRSIIQTALGGERGFGVHESFDGNRLQSALVKLMLPFRMPRLA
ncbi:MAG: carotenoid 1,2-hydratase [Hyphomonas sp.]